MTNKSKKKRAFKQSLEKFINPNKNEVSDYKWLSKDELEEFCSYESNIIAPWFLAIIELYLTKWWPKNSIDYPKYDLCIENVGVLK